MNLDEKYKLIDKLVLDSKMGSKKSKEDILGMLEGLIRSRIRKYFRDYYNYEDLLQDGRLVVLECIEAFDTSKNTKFLGYVNAMLKYKYLEKYRIKTTDSLNITSEDEEIELINLIEGSDDIERDLLLKEDIELVRSKLKTLSKRQKNIIVDFYIKGLSIDELSNKYYITPRTVMNTKTRTLKKIRNQLSTDS